MTRASGRLRLAMRAALVALAGLAVILAASPVAAQTPALATTVDGDRSVDLTLSNGPTEWWFRINSWGTCTAASGATVNNIRGYKAGTHPVAAYSDSGCGTEIAWTSFTIPAATLSAVVNNDRSVDLTLSNGPTDWWFRIHWWGTCTAAAGATVSNIRGYKPGTHPVAAYSDSRCNFHVASTSFTVTSASLSTTVNSDRSVGLTLAGGPTTWWFRVGQSGTCTAATGTTYGDMKGYRVGTYPVWAYSDSGCSYQIASSSFSITLLPQNVAPAAPTNVKIDRACDYLFVLTFTPSPGASSGR